MDMQAPPNFQKFQRRTNIRLFVEQKTEIERVRKVDNDRWSSESHFVRCAVNHYLAHIKKEQEKRGKKHGIY